jgi:sec-independent protein translocase protein TatB
MIDFGFDKLMLIGAVALIVIGPEKLPRVARTVGHFIGKAQRYVADVKAEVNRSIELEELQKMKTQFETAAHDAQTAVNSEISQTSQEFEKSWSELSGEADAAAGPALTSDTLAEPSPAHKPLKKNWRVKRGTTPQWYKQRHGVRTHALSGAARVARFRPPKAPL